MSDGTLLAPRIAAILVDSTKNTVGVKALHESARTVVDRFSRDTAVVGIHDSMNKTEAHPVRDEVRLSSDDSL